MNCVYVCIKSENLSSRKIDDDGVGGVGEVGGMGEVGEPQ